MTVSCQTQADASRTGQASCERAVICNREFQPWSTSVRTRGHATIPRQSARNPVDAHEEGPAQRGPRLCGVPNGIRTDPTLQRSGQSIGSGGGRRSAACLSLGHRQEGPPDWRALSLVLPQICSGHLRGTSSGARPSSWSPRTAEWRSCRSRRRRRRPSPVRPSCPTPPCRTRQAA